METRYAPSFGCGVIPGAFSFDGFFDGGSKRKAWRYLDMEWEEERHGLGRCPFDACEIPPVTRLTIQALDDYASGLLLRERPRQQCL